MQWRNELSTCNGQAEHVQWYKRKALFLIPGPSRPVAKSVHGLSSLCFGKNATFNEERAMLGRNSKENGEAG